MLALFSYNKPTHLRWSLLHFCVVHCMVYALLSALYTRTCSPGFDECLHFTSFLLGLGTLLSSQNFTMVWQSWLCWYMNDFLVRPLFFLGGCIFRNGAVFFLYFATAFFLTWRCSARSLFDTFWPIVSCMPWLCSITWSISFCICCTWEFLDSFVSLKNCLMLETMALSMAWRRTRRVVGVWWHG